MNFQDVVSVIGDEAIYEDGQLEALDPWPEEARVSGDLGHWEKVVFTGEEIVGAIWKSEAGVLRLEDYPFDQTVFVIQGSLTITPEGGEPKGYKQGDIFLFPKGFTGTWDMPEEYKELIIVDRKAWDSQQ